MGKWLVSSNRWASWAYNHVFTRTAWRLFLKNKLQHYPPVSQPEPHDASSSLSSSPTSWMWITRPLDCHPPRTSKHTFPNHSKSVSIGGGMLFQWHWERAHSLCLDISVWGVMNFSWNTKVSARTRTRTHARSVPEWFCGPYLGIFIPEKGKQRCHVHSFTEEQFTF